MTILSQKDFEEYFRTFFVPLSRYAYVFVKDQETAKELVQDTFLKIWERRETFSIDGSVQAYLYRAVKNRSLNYVRDHKRFQFVTTIPDHAEVDTSTPQNDLIDDLPSLINNLPERCREIFLMKRMQGLSYKQISQQLSISEKTVENQMTIAFRRLRELLQQQTLGDSQSNVF